MLLHLRSNQSDEEAPHGASWHIFYFESCHCVSLGGALWIISGILGFAIGFPVCVLILRKILKPRQSGTPLTPSNLFILHLTIMDTIFLTLIPLEIFNHIILQDWIVELAIDSLYSFDICGRPLMMACMCLDCYIAVLHPITYHKRKSMTPRIVMICFVWACSFAISVVFFLFSRDFFLISLLTIVIATVTVGISDSLIIHALLKSGSKKKNIKLKKRAVKTLINSLVMTMLFYLNPIVLYVITKVTMSNGYLASALFTLGSGVMPILNFVNRGKCSCCRLGCSA